MMAGGVVRNPKGPDAPYDPAEPTEKKRVHRVGPSFAPMNTAPATSWAPAAKVKSPPKQPRWVPLRKAGLEIVPRSQSGIHPAPVLVRDLSVPNATHPPCAGTT